MKQAYKLAINFHIVAFKMHNMLASVGTAAPTSSLRK